MANIKDYLDWRGDITLEQSHFNEVDNLILSELAYFNFNKIITNKKISLKVILEEYLNKYTEKEIKKEIYLFQNPLPFLKSLHNSKRFNKLKLFNYVNIISKKEEKQFSALCIELNYNTIYVAFKGTDNSLLGWKEDFNLSYMNEIPSQIEATNYLNKIPRRYKNIIVGGHSKGGNLAIYAGVNCKNRIKKRIKIIYNNDGPGFLKEFTNQEKYQNMLKKITTIVPETSIIGMLLSYKGEYKVIKSSSKGIWEHDPLSWCVKGDSFETIESTNETSDKLNNVITEWLTKISRKEREVFVNTLFEILTKNKLETTEELAKLSIRKIPGLVKSFYKLDKENKELMINLLKDLVNITKKQFDSKTIIKGIRVINKRK